MKFIKFFTRLRNPSKGIVLLFRSKVRELLIQKKTVGNFTLTKSDGSSKLFCAFLLSVPPFVFVLENFLLSLIAQPSTGSTNGPTRL